MHKTIGLTALLLIALSPFASALELDVAKARGLVGEQPDGYLGVVQATPESVALAAEINAKRKAAYEGIARQNGATLAEVSALTAQKVIEKAPAGTFVKSASGEWVKKP